MKKEKSQAALKATGDGRITNTGPSDRVRNGDHEGVWMTGGRIEIALTYMDQFQVDFSRDQE